MESQSWLTAPGTVTPTVKAFLEYPDLMQQLIDRGMNVSNRDRCERRLAQVGYCRLLEYWHSSRTYNRSHQRQVTHNNQFQPNIHFEATFDFHFFDKTLRQELVSAIERTEIYFRTIIAHEMGGVSPPACEDKSLFSADAFDVAKKGPNFDDQATRHQKLSQDCNEGSIRPHFANSKPIPIRAAMEAQDFGLLPKFYSMLKDEYRDIICNRAGIDKRDVLDNWSISVDGLRNRCAHYSRFCNRPNPCSSKLSRNGYFNLLNISQSELERLFGVIAVIWFLIKKTGPSSNWLDRIADLTDIKPNAPSFYFSSMGFDRTLASFPRTRFNHQFRSSQVTESNKFVTIEQLTDELEKLISIELFDVDASLTDRLLQLAKHYEGSSFQRHIGAINIEMLSLGVGVFGILFQSLSIQSLLTTTSVSPSSTADSLELPDVRCMLKADLARFLNMNAVPLLSLLYY